MIPRLSVTLKEYYINSTQKVCPILGSANYIFCLKGLALKCLEYVKINLE